MHCGIETWNLQYCCSARFDPQIPKMGQRKQSSALQWDGADRGRLQYVEFRRLRQDDGQPNTMLCGVLKATRLSVAKRGGCKYVHSNYTLGGGYIYLMACASISRSRSSCTSLETPINVLAGPASAEMYRSRTS